MSYCPLLQSKVVPLIQKLIKIVYMFPILCKKNKCYVVTTFKFSTSHKILPDFLQGSNIYKLFLKNMLKLFVLSSAIAETGTIFSRKGSINVTPIKKTYKIA